MSTIYLAHIKAWDPLAGAEVTLRFADAPFVTGTDAAYRPPGVAAHVAYDPRIRQPASMRRDCFARGATGGESQVGYGELVLINADGALDALLDYGFDGREIEILAGHMRPWQAPTWTTVIKGTMEQPLPRWEEMPIRLRDRQAALDVPVCATRYGGTNELPDGLDGVATDIKGRVKPRLYGYGFNVAPPLVNTSRLIYQVSDAALASVDAVYDRGAALTKGADYTSQSDMETTAPAAATFRAWPAGGCFRLGSSPAGEITADATAGAAAANRTAAQIAQAIVTGPGGIASGDVSAADIAALDAAAPAELCLWVSDETTCRAALDAVAASVGAWWGFDRTGVFRIARLDLPAGTPVAELDDSNIRSFDRVPTADTGAGVPAWRATLAYRPNSTVQTSDLAGSVSATRRAELAEPARKAVAEDAGVQTAHLLATELAWETRLAAAADADAECGRRHAIYKARRDRFEARVALDPALIAALDLGAVVRVTLPRFGLAAGRLLRVIGMQPDLRLNQIDLTLWG